MGRPPVEELTDRELEVMHVFWAGGVSTAAEARDHLARNGLDRSYATIANLVRALHDKGFLRQTNADRPFAYEAIRSFEEVSGRLLGHLVRRVFRGSRTQLLCRLAEQRELTVEERAVLLQILEREGR